jgi:hypothetical protein
MDFLDILIYIVFGAIGIFSSINNSKAKKQAASKRKEQPPVTREAVPTHADEVTKDEAKEVVESPIPEVMVSLDDIFKALREGRPLEVGRRKPPVAKPAPIEKVTKESKPIEEGISVTRNNDLIKNEISDKGIYDDDNEVALDVDRIDWRQAVITSEILNRKY